MEDYKAKLHELLQEEKELQFTQFTNEMAFQMGCRVVELASLANQSITVDISRNGQQLFHCALTGRSVDSDAWVRRKSNVVNRFSQSSLYVGTYLRSIHKNIQERYYLEPGEYAASGGAFPIRLLDVGVVGCIAISGLTEEEDHRLATTVLREFVSRV